MNRITNYRSFINMCSTKKSWLTKYTELGKPKPFDVSLRDGLQSLPAEQHATFTLDRKIQLYKQIMEQHEPEQIEIGSITSNKVFPIFNDSKDLLEYARYQRQETNHFMLIPNKYKLLDLLADINIKSDVSHERDCKYISFITSVSDAFQKKNTKKTIAETREEITDMIHILDTISSPNASEKSDENYHIKLYISCINECPLQGKINNDFIVEEIVKYHTQTKHIHNICLSDTMGTLHDQDFTYIIDKCNQQGVPFSKFSLHLHVNRKHKSSTETIFYSALDRNITLFDVSMLDTGGCSVTMKASQLSPNLSYDLYYEYLLNYIMRKTT